MKIINFISIFYNIINFAKVYKKFLLITKPTTKKPKEQYTVGFN